MICPACGYVQIDAPRCKQCGAEVRRDQGYGKKGVEPHEAPTRPKAGAARPARPTMGTEAGRLGIVDTNPGGVFLPHTWIRVLNQLNRGAAVIAFFLILFLRGLWTALGYASLLGISFFLITALGQRINIARASDPLDELLMAGRMPASMFWTLIGTTFGLVAANALLILVVFFL